MTEFVQTGFCGGRNNLIGLICVKSDKLQCHLIISITELLNY